MRWAAIVVSACVIYLSDGPFGHPDPRPADRAGHAAFSLQAPARPAVPEPLPPRLPLPLPDHV